MNMQNLMAQAQRMQRDIMKKKEEVEKQSFTGKSELVEITMNGNKVVTEVIILLSIVCLKLRLTNSPSSSLFLMR